MRVFDKNWPWMALAVACCIAPAEASYWHDGNKLQSYCEGDIAARVHGMNFVIGFDDGNTFNASTSNPKGYCTPNGVTGRQMIDIVCKYLSENPQKRHETGASLTYSALSDAFPCS